MSQHKRADEEAAEKNPPTNMRRPDDQGPLILRVSSDDARPTGNMQSFQRAAILDAQRSIGNKAVSETLARATFGRNSDPSLRSDEVSSGGIRQSFSLRATIPWGRDSSAPVAASAGWTKPMISRDSVEAGGQEVTAEEPEPGTVKMSMTDAVSSALTFTPSTSRGNPALSAGEFGLTSWAFAVQNPVAKADGAKKVFNVTAKVDCPIGWEVHSLGRTDIASSTSPSLKKGNWATAVSDLTPDATSDGGRPPRTKFWAQDLTEKHEQFHAAEVTTFGKAAFDLATKWLDTQTASDEATAIAVTNQVPNQMNATIQGTLMPKAEFRAYSDGAPFYQSRVNDIKKSGDAGGYPA